MLWQCCTAEEQSLNLLMEISQEMNRRALSDKLSRGEAAGEAERVTGFMITALSSETSHFR